MDQHVEGGKTQEYQNECAGREQARQRELSREYMKNIHGLVESREPAYRPAKGSGAKRYGMGKGKR